MGSLEWHEAPRPERLAGVPRIRLRREDSDRIYQLFAALSAIVYASEDPDFGARCRAVPGGWRDLRMIRVKLERLMDDLMWTVPIDKLVGLHRDMPRFRYDVVLAPLASRETKPTEMIVDRRDVKALIREAHGARCRLCLEDGRRCGRCDLGRVLDRLCMTDRDGRSWSMTEVDGLVKD